MSTKQERIKVFQDTMDWIENDIELSASVIYSKEHTRHRAVRVSDLFQGTHEDILGE